MQVQRPNVTDFDVRRVVVPGPANHFTPLVQDVLGPASLVELVPAPLDPLGIEAKLQGALTGSSATRAAGHSSAAAADYWRKQGDIGANGAFNKKTTLESSEAESVRRRLLTNVDGVRRVLLGWLAEVTDEKQLEIR